MLIFRHPIEQRDDSAGEILCFGDPCGGYIHGVQNVHGPIFAKGGKMGAQTPLGLRLPLCERRKDTDAVLKLPELSETPFDLRPESKDPFVDHDLGDVSLCCCEGPARFGFDRPCGPLRLDGLSQGGDHALVEQRLPP